MAVTDGVGAASLGGWTVSGIYTGRSGRPFTVTQSQNVGMGATGLPNLVGEPEGDRTVDTGSTRPHSRRPVRHFWERRT